MMIMPFHAIRDILTELLDLPEEEIRPEHYLVRDLGLESIDFLELAVLLNERFSIQVDDDTVFLFKLRDILAQVDANSEGRLERLRQSYPFLSPERLTQIIADLPGGPVVKVADLVSYVQWRQKTGNTAP